MVSQVSGCQVSTSKIYVSRAAAAYIDLWSTSAVEVTLVLLEARVRVVGDSVTLTDVFNFVIFCYMLRSLLLARLIVQYSFAHLSPIGLCRLSVVGVVCNARGRSAAVAAGCVAGPAAYTAS